MEKHEELQRFRIRKIGGSFVVEDLQIAQPDKTVVYRPTLEDAETVVSFLMSQQRKQHHENH